jgi:uncharacterized membrane protein (DUF373 family)
MPKILAARPRRLRAGMASLPRETDTMADIEQTDRQAPSLRAEQADQNSPFAIRIRSTADWMHKGEQMVYATVGFMLMLALVIALLGSGKLLWQGALDWSGSDAIYHIIDRLLFVLMLVEILHTVHASVRSGTLLCEPFLIVGLIACIRRILVITLETSQITQPERWNPDNQSLFQASMIELGVLATLIVVLVGGIWAISRVSNAQNAEPSGA